jgi:catechol 2,3-dioxygenase-like lactoylglutathione lyase family enzyme
LGVYYDHAALITLDMDRSVSFYRDVLGLELSSRRLLPDGREQAVFHVGEGVLVLFHHPDGRYAVTVKKPRSGMHHLAFGMDEAEFNAILERCGEHGVEIRRKEVNLGAKGEGFAAYFYDPDGNEIEIKKYEEDPGFKEVKAADYHV